MSRLEEIIVNKRVEVEQLRVHEKMILQKATAAREFRGFEAALRRSDEQMAIIAEVKKASPSAGVISEFFDPGKVGADYEKQGADAISVLTDKKFFQGSLSDLIIVRDAVSLPVLRKDFVVDALQIVEAAAAGADAVLLIVAALSQDDLLLLHETAGEYHLDAVVEIHSAEELDRAIEVGAKIIGINNRDLTTFEVDLAVTEALSELVPKEVTLVSESGYKTVDDVRRAHKCGVDAVLVGESLMRGHVSIEELRTDLPE